MFKYLKHATMLSELMCYFHETCKDLFYISKLNRKYSLFIFALVFTHSYYELK